MLLDLLVNETADDNDGHGKLKLVFERFTGLSVREHSRHLHARFLISLANIQMSQKLQVMIVMKQSKRKFPTVYRPYRAMRLPSDSFENRKEMRGQTGGFAVHPVRDGLSYQ
jgi:hypothetical protein